VCGALQRSRGWHSAIVCDPRASPCCDVPYVAEAWRDSSVKRPFRDHRVHMPFGEQQPSPQFAAETGEPWNEPKARARRRIMPQQSPTKQPCRQDPSGSPPVRGSLAATALARARAESSFLAASISSLTTMWPLPIAIAAAVVWNAQDQPPSLWRQASRG
jgi:hypothetical protein